MYDWCVNTHYLYCVIVASTSKYELCLLLVDTCILLIDWCKWYIIMCACVHVYGFLLSGIPMCPRLVVSVLGVLACDVNVIIDDLTYICIVFYLYYRCNWSLLSSSTSPL